MFIVCLMCCEDFSDLPMSTIQLHDLVIFNPALDGRRKSKCGLAFAEADKALNDGADEELWVLEVGLKVHKAVSS